MQIYKAKYYPIVNGVKKEYTTTVEAENKEEAAKFLRDALVYQLQQANSLIQTLQAEASESLTNDIASNIKYAKEKMKVVIL